MIVEVGSRDMPGVGTVELVMDDTKPDFYLVFVKDEFGLSVTSISAATRAAALDAYWHPFARSATPNLFNRIIVSDS